MRYKQIILITYIAILLFHSPSHNFDKNVKGNIMPKTFLSLGNFFPKIILIKFQEWMHNIFEKLIVENFC